MRIRGHSLAIGPLFVLLAVTAACGGGEQPTTPAATTSSRPTPTAALQATATSRPQVTATAAAQPTATPAPQPTAPPRPSPTAAPRPTQPTGKLVIALPNLSTEDLDPITTTNSVMWSYAATMYDWAIWHQKDGGLAPGVFEAWEQARDGMSWTLTLRRGMQFHNGTPVTADDVKFDIERALTPEATSGSTAIWKGNVASVAATGTNTVIARLKQPWPLMPSFLGADGGNQGVVYPRAAFQQAANARAFFNSPVGTGPFRIASRQTGIRITFEASELKHPYRPQPAFQTLEFLPIPEESTRAAMIRTGAADIVSTSPEGLPGLRQSGMLILQLPEITGVYLRFWGLDNPDGLKGMPTADVRVREALHLAVNKQEIVDTLLQGFGTVPAREIVIPGTEGFDPAWKPLPYDPARAKELLTAAGFARGFRQRIFNPAIPGAPWTVRAGEAIAGYWANIGVQTEIVPIDYGAWQQLFRERPHKTALGAYGWLFAPKRVNSLGTLPNSYRSGGPLQLLTDPQLDTVIDRALTTQDAQEREQLIRRIVQTAFEAHLSIPVAYTPELYAASAKIDAWDPIRVAGAALSWETLRRK